MADRLAQGRERGFVGRRAEGERFAALLASGAGAVVHVHGPGGIGKSALVHWLAAQGVAAGRTLLRPDAEELARDLADGEFAARLAGARAVLLVLDPADAIVDDPGGLDERLLHLLPADALVLLATRQAPPLAWRTDPAWHGLLHPMALGPLDPADSRELLRRRGVPGPERDRAVRATHGHPLALALAADLWRQTGTGLRRLGDAPSVVEALLEHLLEAVPSALHRAALEASAQVLVTTEPLLAALLEVPDAGDVFDWLQGLSAVHRGTRGLYPHDLVRRALDARLRWRAPERRAALTRRAVAYYQRFFDAGDHARQRTVLTDFAFLHRDSPAVATVLTPVLDSVRDAAPPLLERLTIVPAAPGDLPALRAMTEAHEGRDSAELLAAWDGHPAATTSVVREPGGPPKGFSTVVVLGREPDPTGPTGSASPAAPADPAVEAARGWLLDRDGGDLRAGEHALLVRHWMSREQYQDVSAVQLLITLRLTHGYLTRRPPALTLLPFAEPERWQLSCAYVDFTRAPGADFTVGGHRYGVFAHDWRRTPPLAWLDLLCGRQAGDDPRALPAAPAPPHSGTPDREPFARAEFGHELFGHEPFTHPEFSREEFAAGVRQAVRGLGRADGLHGADLLRARLVTSAPDGRTDATRVLREALLEAAAALEASPLDRRAFRALHHTYLQPAPSQQRAADLLDLPMTTYRRHLAKGLARLTELLWLRETDLRAGRAGRPGG
ncbi:ATP-binding protein [Kitasatospora nipponensis]|uniref:ATP-binding protein n=1 Tax=Kitasatospora nipponensis TaxID=258049 RepID=A0ABP4H8T6_9ACTN